MQLRSSLSIRLFLLLAANGPSFLRLLPISGINAASEQASEL